jgi:hypothetical protein
MPAVADWFISSVCYRDEPPPSSTGIQREAYISLFEQIGGRILPQGNWGRCASRIPPPVWLLNKLSGQNQAG